MLFGVLKTALGSTNYTMINTTAHSQMVPQNTKIRGIFWNIAAWLWKSKYDTVLQLLGAKGFHSYLYSHVPSSIM